MKQRNERCCFADNKVAEEAGWDLELLAIELPELADLLIEEDLDISLTGFEPAEIDQLVANFEESAADPADDIHADWLSLRPVSQPGDLWQLGRHRLLCADARQATSLDRLLGAEKAAMAFLDPPYNVKIKSVVGRGRTKHREFAMASGEMSRQEFVQFLRETLGNAAAHCRAGAVHYVCIDWRHVGELVETGTQTYGAMLNLVVWVKSNSGQGSFYRSQHELIGVFQVGESRHLNNVQLGRHGRSRSNVWHYAGVNSFRAGRMDELKAHPTAKPVALVADAIKDCTQRRDIVLDTFRGPAPRSWLPNGWAVPHTVLNSMPDTSMSPFGAGKPSRDATRSILKAAKPSTNARRNSSVHRQVQNIQEAPMVRKPPLDSSVEEGSYEVGYCKPPRHARFTPGRSGNPRGRPRKSKNFTTIVRQVLEEKIPARAGEKTRKISKAEAVAIRLINSAAQGDPKAITAFLQMMRATGLIGEEDSSITSTETVDGVLADHQAILLLDGKWCLADFGISRYAESTTAPDTQKYAWTPAYAAPERWRAERATIATDVYALGVIAFEMASAGRPFIGPDLHDYRHQHLHEDPPDLPQLPVNLASLIEECLYKAPEARPRPANVAARLPQIQAAKTSAGLERLKAANLAEVERKGEAARRASELRSEVDQRRELLKVAVSSMKQVGDALLQAISTAAPSAEIHQERDWWRLSLNGRST